MAPRISVANQAVLDEFEFEFAEPPSKQATRLSKYDAIWEAARKVAMAYPGNALRVRQYNTSASAYNDAKAINNSEHRHFKDGKTNWTAVAAKTVDEDGNVVMNDNGNPLFDLYLTYSE